MFSQRMVENFFKRTKFRRSRRLRSSFRTSLIKKGSASPSAAAGGASNVSSPAASKRVAFSTADRRSDGGATGSLADDALRAGITVSIKLDAATDQQQHHHDRQQQQQRLPSPVEDHFKADSGVDAARSTQQRRPAAAMSSTAEDNSSNGLDSSPEQRRDGHALMNGNGVRQGCNIVGRPISSAGSLPVLPRPELNGNAHDTVDPITVECLRIEVESLRKELSKKQDTIAKMQDREKQLRERLSEQAQRQLERGASKFEDISLGENRPTQLVKRYGNLYSEARLDAMDALDELPDMTEADDLKVKLLLSIVVLAFRSAQRTLLETKTKIRELLHIPDVLHGGSTTLSHLVQEVEDTIAVYLRKTVEKHDVTKNYEEVCDRVWETLYDYPTLRTCSGLLRYVDECVRLAWALTLQNPPLVVDYESKRFDSTMHVRFHTSDPDSSDIKSVLWPVLTEGDGGLCVYRGVVVT